MSAARLMMEGGVGILRTLPPPAPQTVDELRRRAIALGVRWPPGQGDAYPEVIRGLDPNVPTHAALLAAAARLFRGAGYLAFRDGPPPGTDPVHAAVAAHYAHVTAPLRRLVDRFGNEIVLALCAGQEPPTWATDALDELPDLMQAGRRREAAANGMALDLVEAAVLACCEGTLLDAVVISVGRERATVQVRDPAIATSVPSGRLRAGQEVRVRVVGADVPRRRLDLEAVAGYQS
jgi:exoribonuclease R